ncbi:MAG: hypothetical protein QOI05_4642 [Bradyrhizobium sp.]|nr:hypothetical protein [Bradyrhizobium sp.]
MQARGPRALAFFAMSCAIAAGLFLWQGWQDFSLSDEGFLWYGAQRVMAGEVPLRDFQSYDPGRYYWSAAIMTIGGDGGIVALRAAIAACQVVGLTIALLLISGRGHRLSVPLIILAAATLGVWMYPRHKLFDITLSVALIAALAFMIRGASPKSCFAAGVVVGLAAVFGRNHGMYGVAASIGAIAWLATRENALRFRACLPAWAAGMAIGYLPMLAMIVFVPGFATAFWESVRFLFEMKTTNLPLPVPWPWLVPIATDFSTATARDFLIGMFFVALPVFGVLGVACIIQKSLRHKAVAPEMASCILLSLPYAHFAFSRSDVNHLAQGAFPLLVGCFVAMRSLRGARKWPLAILLTAASLFIMLPQQPGWGCRVEYDCVETDIAGDKLNVDLGSANRLRLLKELVGTYARDGRSFVAAPLWPGAYALFRRKSPTWEIFALFPRSEAFQLHEIENIREANPGFVVVWDVALDGNEDLRFRNTHPLVDRFFRDHFDRLPEGGPPLGYQMYKSR